MEAEYRYPRRVRAPLRWGTLLLAALIVGRGLLGLLRLLVWLVERARPLPVGEFWRLSTGPLPALVGAVALVALGLLVAWIGRTLLPELTPVEGGLTLHGGRAPRRLAWDEIDSIFATRPGGGSRLLLYLRSASAPWTSRLTGLVIGAGARPGYLITSTIEGFEPVMAYVLRELEGARGAQGLRFDEGQSGPLLELLLAPGRRLEQLWPTRYQSQQVRPQPEREALIAAGRVAVAVAAALPALILIDSLVSAELRVSPLLVFLIGLVEWPVAAYWLVAVADLVGRSVDWSEMLALYPTVQWPRWLVVALAALLLLVGAPRWTLLIVFAVGIVGQGWLHARLTRQLFAVPAAQGWVGSAIPLIFQALLYGVTYWVLR